MGILGLLSPKPSASWWSYHVQGHPKFFSSVAFDEACMIQLLLWSFWCRWGEAFREEIAHAIRWAIKKECIYMEYWNPCSCIYGFYWMDLVSSLLCFSDWVGFVNLFELVESVGLCKTHRPDGWSMQWAFCICFLL